MIDHERQFWDVFVEMSNSMNDFQILQLFSFYQKTTFEGMFNFEHGPQIGIHPYLIRDKGYLFLP